MWILNPIAYQISSRTWFWQQLSLQYAPGIHQRGDWSESNDDEGTSYGVSCDTLA
jgi:hypothetical protein